MYDRNENYFDPCHLGQEVGLLLNFDKGSKGSIMVTVNGQSVGYLFENCIPPGTYFPVVSLLNNG